MKPDTTIADKVFALLENEQFMKSFNGYYSQLKRRIEIDQGNVHTFADNSFFSLIDRLLNKNPFLHPESDEPDEMQKRYFQEGIETLRMLIASYEKGRFVNYFERLLFLQEYQGISGQRMALSQGLKDCMKWKGQPIFKTAFDLSIYQMLIWEIKPKTILEIGSGVGSSAIWFADQFAVFGLEGSVYSLDIKKPEISYDRVTFLEGDCAAIGKTFTDDFLSRAPHPWIVIEDAHAHVGAVLAQIHRFAKAGDYLIVEDSEPKVQELKEFMDQHQHTYQVDTYYADFFGTNATCSPNSIFRKSN